MIARLAALWPLAGCQLVFQPQADVQCTGKFSAEFEVFFEQGSTKFDPSTNILGELWFTVPSGPRDLYFATPNGLGFAAAVRATFNDDVADDYDPASTEDGSRLLFISNRNSGSRVFEVVRDGDMFSAPLMRGDIPTVEGIDISRDGLRLYYTTPDGMFVTERPSLDGAFTAPRLLALVGEFPSISTDELELYYNVDATRIARRTRRAIAEGFGAEESPLEGAGAPLLDGNDAEISHDGTTLLFVDGNKVFGARRECRL